MSIKGVFRSSRAIGPVLKRIRVTVDITVPFEWTIGKTERFINKVFSGFRPIVHEQRLAREEKTP